ncbi:VOC family protein [Chitinophaga sp. 22620]|uniref:VOC family protein n=1 Tax=Chitinophaga sp. 22620 TaxID=3453952 RepID=UPI003F85B373
MEKRISTQKITPNLWFTLNAEEAIDYYLGIFKNSKKGRSTYYGEEGFEIHKIPAGTLMTQEFYLEGQEFLALNGGPYFQFNEAISFIVNCDSQEEVDYYWDKLTQGGPAESQMCGWLKDKFGVSWQVVPVELTEMMLSDDKEAAARVTKEVLSSKKLDLNKLRAAFGK